jgi:OmcA/MtrC family decaheme c-type cytochrome
MQLIQRGFLLLATAGVIALPSSVPVSSGGDPGPVKRDSAPAARTYGALEKEAYLASDTISYIRPGCNITIVGITGVTPGGKPTVEFKLTDDLGQPLDRNGALTPGVISPRFIVASWDAATRRYTNLLVTSAGVPTRDTAGTFVEMATGWYKYTFSLALASSFDTSKPATVRIGARRVTTDIVGKDYWAADTFLDFVPATPGTKPTTFTAMTVARCNQCHDPIAPHGGNYRDIKTCVLCHNPNNMKGANTHFDGQIFYHALHLGLDATIGTGPTYPQNIRNCTTCHDPAAAGGSSWYTYPSRAACGSCHNDIVWTGTGANHTGGPQADDTACASCHAPVGNREWDASIQGAHTLPILSKQLKGLNASIISVTNVGPGKKPTVTFSLKNGDGSAIDPKFFATAANGSFSLVLAGPTTDYGAGATTGAQSQPISESPAPTAVFDGTNATYTFTAAIPATAKGTWAVAIQCRRTVALNPAPRKGPTSLSEPPAANPVFYIAVTGTTAVPRRTLVSLTKCNACHAQLVNLFSHGNQRVSIEFCVVCHNPNADDSGRRPTDGSANPAESISFKRMIHRIHTGNLLEQDYTVYGFGGAISNFNEVTYPGDRRNCLACHTNAAAYSLPTGGTLDTVTKRDFYTPQGPATAACLGCHDNRDAVAHAYLNTANFPGLGPAEACATCHGTGKDWDVAKEHAR